MARFGNIALSALLPSRASRRSLLSGALAALVAPPTVAAVPDGAPSGLRGLLDERARMARLHLHLTAQADRLRFKTRAAHPPNAMAKRYRKLRAAEKKASLALVGIDDAIASFPAATLDDAIGKLRFYCREQGYRLPEVKRSAGNALAFEERLLHSVIGDLERLDRRR